MKDWVCGVVCLCVMAVACAEKASEVSRPPESHRKASEVRRAPESHRARLGEKTELSLGDTAVIEGQGLAVRFDAVKEDSRCPTGVQCIWEGNARVVVEVKKEGEEGAALELNTSLRFPGERVYQGYTVRLLSLEPYPREGTALQRADYTAALVIDRAPAREEAPQASSPP